MPPANRLAPTVPTASWMRYQISVAAPLTQLVARRLREFRTNGFETGIRIVPEISSHRYRFALAHSEQPEVPEPDRNAVCHKPTSESNLDSVDIDSESRFRWKARYAFRRLPAVRP